MREIEFRAYLKENKQIVDVLDIDFMQETIGYMNKATKYTCANFNDIELMQYTGLKDKNGKKIFEGDIVKDILGQVGKIVYKEKCSAFVVDKWECGYALWFDKGIEVIGNIYDNQELTGEEV